MTAAMEWAPTVTEITRYRGKADWLVEPFRRADWVDVSRGGLSFGTPRTLIAKLYANWPDAASTRA